MFFYALWGIPDVKKAETKSGNFFFTKGCGLPYVPPKTTTFFDVAHYLWGGEYCLAAAPLGLGDLLRLSPGDLLFNLKVFTFNI